MKIGLIIILTAAGFFIFGPFGAIGGLIIGCFAGLQKNSENPNSSNPALDRAMAKVKAEGDARRAANREKL